MFQTAYNTKIKINNTSIIMKKSAGCGNFPEPEAVNVHHRPPNDAPCPPMVDRGPYLAGFFLKNRSKLLRYMYVYICLTNVHLPVTITRFTVDCLDLSSQSFITLL